MAINDVYVIVQQCAIVLNGDGFELWNLDLMKIHGEKLSTILF